MSIDLKLLGDIIREERLNRGLSQEYFAELSNISRSYLGEIERGEVNLSITVLSSLSEALDMNLSKILEKYEQQ